MFPSGKASFTREPLGKDWATVSLIGPLFFGVSQCAAPCGANASAPACPRHTAPCFAFVIWIPRPPASPPSIAAPRHAAPKLLPCCGTGTAEAVPAAASTGDAARPPTRSRRRAFVLPRLSVAAKRPIVPSTARRGEGAPLSSARPKTSARRRRARHTAAPVLGSRHAAAANTISLLSVVSKNLKPWVA